MMFNVILRELCARRRCILDKLNFSHSTDSKRDSIDANQTEDMGGGDGGGSQP